jgi:hypothetical protein
MHPRLPPDAAADLRDASAPADPQASLAAPPRALFGTGLQMNLLLGLAR